MTCLGLSAIIRPLFVPVTNLSFLSVEMSNRSHGLSVVLFTGDSHLASQIEHDLGALPFPTTLTVVKDVAAAHRAIARHAVDGVIIETRRGRSKELTRLQHAIDPARTFVLAGSRAVLRSAAGFMLASTRPPSGKPAMVTQTSLEDYLDSKLGEFVRGMKNGSARNLHPMLIKALERPLISHALKETNGNQIKTAHLLGMNRNTLRKKITELRIPVQRERLRRALA